MSRHIKALDGIRGIAILLVLAGHLLPYRTASSLSERVLNGVAGLGWSGVSLFFVLSGFLITGILSDSKDDPRFFRNFYARRALRIFPLYYLFVTLCLVVLPLFPALASAKPGRDAWMYWVYLSNFHDAFHAGKSDGWLGPMWSLAVEEHFYLVWPALILLNSRRSAINISLGAIVLASLFRLWFVLHGNVDAPYVFTLCRMDDLAGGALIALLLREHRGSERLGRAAAIGVPVAGALALGLTVWKHAVIWNPVLQLAGLPLFMLFFASLLILAVVPLRAAGWKRVLETRGLRFFGKYSYALYVFHPAVAALMPHVILFPTRMVRTNDWVNAGVVIGVTVVVALISWNVYEKQFLRMKRWFEPKRSPNLSSLGYSGESAPRSPQLSADPLS